MTPVAVPVAAGLLGDPFADAMREGASWVMAATMGWWVAIPSVALEGSPAATIRSYVLWLALVVATLGLMWQALLMILSRGPEPLLTIARGLFTLVLWAGIGIAAPAAALRAGDSFSTWVLIQAADGKPVERLQQLASLTGVDSSGAVIVLGLLLMLAGLVQAIVMIFREGAVVVLAGVVVLAAAGSMTASTRGWLPRVLGWMAALIAYKPVAALVYASAVALMGRGDDARTVLVGLTMMLLAIVALPALMKFFSWTTDGISAGQGSMAMLGVSLSAASTAAALYGARARSASDQASQLRSDLGQQGTPPDGAPGGQPAGPTRPDRSPGGAASPAPVAASGAAAPGSGSTASAAAAPAAGAGATVVAGSAAVDTAATSTAAAGATATGAVPVGAALAVVAGAQAAAGAVRQVASGAAAEMTGEARA